jgi:septal ring factor EnvC (AmiA/AmiB activator)
MKTDASTGLRKDRNGDPRLDLVQLALNGQKIGFDKIMKKIQDLIQILAEEQKEDDVKKDFCEGEIDKTEDELKAQKRAISDTKTVIAETKDSLAQVERDIAGLTEGIKSLDEEVKKATATRKQENQASVEQLATNNAAKQLQDMAKKRLNKFYNPKMYKADSASFVEVQEHQQSDSDQPEAPPDLEHKKSGEAGGGVIQMLMTLKGDLEKSITVVETEEKQAQADYEKFIEDSSEKRAIDTKAIASKESAKAEMEATIHKESGDLKVEIKSEKSIKIELMDLHEDCDWFLKNYGLRKEARADETDSLNKAKAVLSGADYS